MGVNMSEQEKIRWVKPNGAEIDTNAEKATVEYCAKLGWDRVDAAAAKPKARRGRPKKEA